MKVGLIWVGLCTNGDRTSITKRVFENENLFN